MTRSQIVKLVAKEYPHLTKPDIEAIIDIFFDEITQTLANGHRVELRGLGSFGVKTRPSRIGRNPKTGESVHVGKRHLPYFRAGRKLRDAVNK